MNPFAEYRVSSPFGWRTSPITGAREFHTGIDLVKTHEAPIYAFVAGEVVHAKEGATGSGFGGYGIVVAIRDSNTGHLHCYAHLYCAVVKAGDVVHRGQMIGRQGSTGKSTGSHLHYEIRKASSPSFGWIADRANNCFEPTEYLQELYAEESKPKMSDVYKDVPADSFYIKDLELLKEKDILVGYTDGTFQGDKPVTRYEYAAGLAALYKKLGH